MRFLKTWHLTGELLKELKLEFKGESLTIEPGVEVAITVTTINLSRPHRAHRPTAGKNKMETTCIEGIWITVCPFCKTVLHTSGDISKTVDVHFLENQYCQFEHDKVPYFVPPDAGGEG